MEQQSSSTAALSSFPELIASRKQILLEGLPAKEVKKEETDKRLTAEAYLRREFMVKYTTGDQTPLIKLMWRRKEDKIGRARVNVYSASQHAVVESYFVHIWHDEKDWKYEIVKDPEPIRSIFKD